MVGGSTRRGLLGAAGAGALLVGCGDQSGPAPRGDESRGGDSSLADIALLNDAILAETRTIGTLPRARAHVATLERLIARVGGQARPVTRSVAGPSAAEDAAAELVAFYVDLLAKIGEPELRVEVSGLLADAASALARSRDDPAANPFERGRA